MSSYLVTVAGQLGDVLEVVVSDLLQAAQQVRLGVGLVRVGQRPLGRIEILAAPHEVERRDLHVPEQWHHFQTLPEGSSTGQRQDENTG